MKAIEKIKSELEEKVCSFFEELENMLYEDLNKHKDWQVLEYNFRERHSHFFMEEIIEGYRRHIKDVDEHNSYHPENEKEYDDFSEFCGNEFSLFIENRVDDIRHGGFCFYPFLNDVKDEKLVKLSKEISEIGEYLENQVTELNKLENMKKNLLIQQDSLRNLLKERSESIRNTINQIEDVEEQLPKVKKLIKDHLLNRDD